MQVDTFEDGTLIIDTKNVQMASLVAVMQEFGYWFNEDVCNFYDPENEYKIVSFKSAVELHNALEDIACNIWIEESDGYSGFNHFNFSIYDFNRAVGAQIVEKVKLQLNKKNKYIKTQSHKIRFVCPAYENLFL